MNGYDWAIREVKEGRAVKRVAWKERGWWITAALAGVGGVQQPFIYMGQHEGGTVPWAPQQFDQFAEDWIAHDGPVLAFTFEASPPLM